MAQVDLEIEVTLLACRLEQGGQLDEEGGPLPQMPHRQHPEMADRVELPGNAAAGFPQALLGALQALSSGEPLTPRAGPHARRHLGQTRRVLAALTARELPSLLQNQADIRPFHRSEENLHRQTARHPFGIARGLRQEQVAGVELGRSQNVDQTQTDLNRPASVDALELDRIAVFRPPLLELDPAQPQAQAVPPQSDQRLPGAPREAHARSAQNMSQDRHAAVDVAADQELLRGVPLGLDRIDGARMSNRLQE